jgi:thiol:disulfide interchange protein DsbG
MAALVALKGEGIVLGTKGPLVTAFVSPDCLYCIRLFKGLSPLVDAGRVRLRLIIIGPGDERAAAMGIRQSKDPVGALSTHFDGLVSGHDQTPAARPDKVLEHRLDRLESIAAGGQSTYGTPMLLICPQVASPRWVKGLPDFAWLTQSLASWPATGTRCDHASRAV